MNLKEKWLQIRPSRRRLIQVYAALLYNCQLKGFLTGEIYTGPLKNLCVPGLNCYSCPGAIGACPLGALQNALASTTTRAPAYVLGILLLLGLLLGRTICGFLCPFGLIQELLYKIPTPKVKKSRFTRILSWLKYVILAVFVVIIPLINSLQHLPLPAFCKYICPAGTLEGAIGLLSNKNNVSLFSMLGELFTRKYVILVLILFGSVFIYRVFCRFLCPLGAIYGLFARFALIGIRAEQDRCNGCGLCVRRCKMDIKRPGDHECIHCGECIAHCPQQAIHWKLSKKPQLAPNEGEKQTACKPAKKDRTALLWIPAIAVLIGIMLYAHLGPSLLNSTAETGTEDKTAAAAAQLTGMEVPAWVEELPFGMEVGNRLPEFTAALYNGGEYRSADMLGKVQVINFWATWCNPCVKELPHFEQLTADLGDRGFVVALHSSLVTEDVQAWIQRENKALTFGLDADGSIIASLGGSTILPMTVITDQYGVIVYNQVGSVTYEKLTEIITPLLESASGKQ